MGNLEILNGKKLLIVDDEPDELETLRDLLDACDIDTASDYESAERLLIENEYDLAILDIMGVRGYDLLEIATQKRISALMFTARALSSNDFAKSMRAGAIAYIPKQEMSEIASYVADLLAARQAGVERPGNWYQRLKSFFEKQFGSDWLAHYKQAGKKIDWMDFDV